MIDSPPNISSSQPENTPRLVQLKEWLQKCLAERLPEGALALEAISGDAGFRCYYRVAGLKPNYLAVDAPPATENNQAFCHISTLLRQYGIHAPQVYAVDYERGFMLIEDLGGELYGDLLQQGEAVQDEKLYADANRCLLRLAAIPVESAGLVHYDEVKLQQECDFFPQWFAEGLLGIQLDESVAGLLQDMNERLIASAQQQPQVVVHRDFHCRNLLRINNNNPGVIDFQDGVIGPITYDLVSLYRDCYLYWPVEKTKQRVKNHYQQLCEAQLINESEIDAEQFLRWFDWMGLQRHIKVLGIFARLHLRDNKSNYLQDLPLVIHYVLSVAKQYPEFADFVAWFEQTLLPKIKIADWYSDKYFDKYSDKYLDKT